MSGKSIDEVWPDRPPVCAGCGNEVDPAFATTSPDFRLYCGMCVARQKREEKERQRAADAVSGG